LKRLIPLLPALALCLGLTTAAFAGAGPKIILDGLELRPDVPPYQTAGRTMVPLRVIGENLYAVVDWNPARQEVTVVQDGKTIVLTLGSNRALVNGEPRMLDVPAVTRNGRTFVPLRFVSEALGCAVDYRSGVITITSPDDGSRAYLLEANKTHLGLRSVKFQGHLQGVIKVTGHGGTETESIGIGMRGWSGNPGQSYVVMKLTAPGWSESSEVYVDGENEYRRQDGGPWTVSPVLPGRPPGAGMQNPALFAQNLRQTTDLVGKLGIRTRFAADTRVNGRDCRVIVYQLGKNQFTDAGLTILDKVMIGDVEHVKLGVRIYIARETGFLVREVIGLEMAWGAPTGYGTQLTLNGTFDFTDHGGEVTSPDVSGAVAAKP